VIGRHEIKLATSWAGIQQSELARNMGKSKANLSYLLARGDYRQSKLKAIAIALGAKLTVRIEFPDGMTISLAFENSYLQKIPDSQTDT